MRDRLLESVAGFIVKRPWWTLFIVMVVTVACAGMAGQLGLNTEFVDMMPQDDPSTIEFKTITEEYNATSTLFIVAEGDDESLRAFVDDVVPQLEALEQYVSEVVYTAPRDFIADHRLMLAKSEDLENSRTLFEDPNLVGFLTNLNDSFEKEYIDSDEKISNLEQERGAVQLLDGIQIWTDALDDVIDGNVDGAGTTASDATLFGNDLHQSWDRRVLSIQILTTFSSFDFEPVIDCPNVIDSILVVVNEKHGVDSGLTGSIVLGRDKMAAMENDSMIISLLALIGVLIILIVAFRMIVSPLFAILTLVIGVIWAMGIAWPLVGDLNMMTAMMGVMLIGLGIDFSIHIISVYTEMRAKGEDIHTSMVATLKKSGKGIITGAFTTSIAFMTLIFGKTATMQQFGLVLGVGLLLTMVAALTALPMMLVLRERFYARLFKNRKQKPPRDVSYRFLGTIAEKLSNRWIVALVIVIIVVAIFGYRGTKLEMDYDSRNMLVKGLKSLELQDRLIEAFDMDPDYSMLTATSLEEAYVLTEELKDLSTVGVINSIVDLLPPDSEQESRRQLVTEIGKTMSSARINRRFTRADLAKFKTEVARLEANIIEIQTMAFLGGQDKVYLKAGLLVGVIDDKSDSSLVELHDRLNPSMTDITSGKLTRVFNKLEAAGNDVLSNLTKFHTEFAAAYKPTVIRMANTDALTIDDLPDEIRSQYVGKSGEHFLIYVYSKENIWNREYQERLVNDLKSVTERATGMPLIYNALLKAMMADGKIAMQIALFAIFIMLLFDFRSFWKALLAIIPLIFGVLMMIGVMEMSGMMMSLAVIYTVPIIIGIGIDDGVHIIHRYNVEGDSEHSKVFSSTGRAIMLTSLTTMLGFGSLWFATMRSLSYMGITLFIGVGTCFLSTVLVIPILAGMRQKFKR